MLTPQEVSTHAFTKAVMGGYNMAMVDEFLDELTDDYTALYKENAALKAKMKVLVEKVEEYRATEDSMRATLLTAQRMADSIVREAEAKRDEMMAQAQDAARDKIQLYREEIALCEERLNQGRLELARFVAESRAVCEKQLAFLGELPELKVTPLAAAAAPVEDTTADEIGEKVLAAFAAAEEAEQGAAEEAEEPVPAPAEEEVGNPFGADGEDMDLTRRINLSDLKFGRNYGKD